MSTQSISLDPLINLSRQKVNGPQLRTLIGGEINPFTKQPLSPRYKRILEGRRQLPAYAQMDQLMTVFNESQVIVLVGEPGAGKTTQIPQFAAYSDLPHSHGKVVACTQPHRAIAMSAAQRVADEMDVQLGQQVGYSTTLEDATNGDTTFLKYVTDQRLLEEAINDPDFERYSTIILDEAHERALATDILMVLLKGVIKRRSDLKLVVMSASSNAAIQFVEYLSDGSVAPVVLLSVSGRKHPVDLFYTQEPEPDYFEAAIRTTLKIHRAEDPGDILLFLTDQGEIEDACKRIKLEADKLRKIHPNSVGPISCIPLYSTLPPSQQQRIFDPAPTGRPDGPPGRKVVVSTNIAETSLTIDGIVYVVDPGFSKQKVYNPRLRVTSLVVSPISKASAQQRAGLAGRKRPGKCFRLYTEKDFVDKLDEKTNPEILRSNLALTVLQLLKLGVKDLVGFDWVDAPAPETLMRALELLNYLAALDNEGNLTPLGETMANFPLDPQLAKVLIISPQLKCSQEILTVVSMLSVPNIWARPQESQRRCAEVAKALLTVPESDHLTLLNVFDQYMQNKHNEDWVGNNWLSGRVLAQVEHLRRRLERIMDRFDISIVSLADEKQLFSNIRRALVAGFFTQVAHIDGKGCYRTVKDNQVVALHPSCGLETQPEWVTFHEFILTSRPYIRTVTEVKADWLFDYGADYYKLSSFPPGEMKRALQRAWNGRAGRGNNPRRDEQTRRLR